MVFLSHTHYLLIDLINPCKLWHSDFPVDQKRKGWAKSWTGIEELGMERNWAEGARHQAWLISPFRFT